MEERKKKLKALFLNDDVAMSHVGEVFSPRKRRVVLKSLFIFIFSFIVWAVISINVLNTHPGVSDGGNQCVQCCNQIKFK